MQRKWMQIFYLVSKQTLIINHSLFNAIKRSDFIQFNPALMFAGCLKYGFLCARLRVQRVQALFKETQRAYTKAWVKNQKLMRLDEAEPPRSRSNAMEYNRTTRVPKEGLIPSHFHFEQNLIPYRYASSRLTDTHPKCIISVENPAQAVGRASNLTSCGENVRPQGLKCTAVQHLTCKVHMPRAAKCKWLVMESDGGATQNLVFQPTRKYCGSVCVCLWSKMRALFIQSCLRAWCVCGHIFTI
jgi:hypothetical protein